MSEVQEAVDPWSELALPVEDVARLTKPARKARVEALIEESKAIISQAEEQHLGGKTLVGRAVLFSGGNDSTTLADLMYRTGLATHAIHANTTIGIEETRQYVRDTCAAWGLPLIECTGKPWDNYRLLVLNFGFPGPGHHSLMYQRLKEHAFNAARNQLVKKPHRERIMFIAGRRRTESDRRANVPEMERTGSIIWASPLINWTKLDLNTYRLMFPDVPHNEVTDHLHMSGECLCGAFAHKGELAEIEAWYPDVVKEILTLEEALEHSDKVPRHRRRWGWGAEEGAVAKLLEAVRAKAMTQEEMLREFERLIPRSGKLCGACDTRLLESIKATAVPMPRELDYDLSTLTQGDLPWEKK